MIEQQGRVLSLGPERVTILLGTRTGCPSCDAGKGCGAGLFGRLISRKPITLELTLESPLETAPEKEGHLPLIPGQAVLIGIPEAFFLRLLVRFYLLPVLAGLLGAVLGHALAGALQWAAAGQDLLAALGALFFAALALLIRRNRNQTQLGEQALHIRGYPAFQPGQLCQMGPEKTG